MPMKSDKINMNRYSPSALRCRDRYCPRALDFYQQRVKLLDDPFTAGTAAHMMLERLAKHPNPEKELTFISNHVFEGLVTHGRAGDNEPLPPSEVKEGIQLALDWYVIEKPTENCEVEVGVSFDRDWKQVEWEAEGARFRLVFDMIDYGTFGDEEFDEFGYEAWRVRDYKTGWNVDETELDSIQMRAQAVACALLHPDWICIRREVVNLRTQKTYAANTHDKTEIEAWKHELELVMDSCDRLLVNGGPSRPARITHRCMTCPYAKHCDAAHNSDFDIDQPKFLAEEYVRACGERKYSGDLLKAHVKEIGPVEFEDSVFCHNKVEKLDIDANGANKLFEIWEKRGGDVRGFFAATKGIGVTQARAAAKALYPEDKDKQAKLIADISTVKITGEFTAIKK